MIIECAGLPGAGKTTVCQMVKVPHGGKGSVPLSHLRLNQAIMAAAWRVIGLCATVRPFRLDRLKRSFNLIVFLRHYKDRERIILLDQGIVQKLWSILADAEPISEKALTGVLSSLAPFAPDLLIWFDTPSNDATDRMSARREGRSRYDRLEKSEAALLLQQRTELLRMLAERICSAAGIEMLVFNGDTAPEANAARIDGLLDAASNTHAAEVF